MTIPQAIVYWLVYTISLILIHPALFLWGWARFVAGNAVAMVRFYARLVWRMWRG